LDSEVHAWTSTRRAACPCCSPQTPYSSWPSFAQRLLQVLGREIVHASGVPTCSGEYVQPQHSQVLVLAQVQQRRLSRLHCGESSSTSCHGLWWPADGLASALLVARLVDEDCPKAGHGRTIVIVELVVEIAVSGSSGRRRSCWHSALRFERLGWRGCWEQCELVAWSQQWRCHRQLAAPGNALAQRPVPPQEAAASQSRS
jgi:hypothetical protein